MTHPSITPDAMLKRIKHGWGDDEVMNRPKSMPQWRWKAEQRLGYCVTRAIREMRSDGLTWAEIGAELGCNRETVRRVANGLR